MTGQLFAVLSDVHGNDLALHACLEDARREAAKRALPLHFWCLGDVVNGLPGVGQCLRLLESLGTSLTEWLLGNHDLAQLLWWPDKNAEPLPRTAEHMLKVTRNAVRFIRSDTELSLLAEDVSALNELRLSKPDLWRRWTSSPTWAWSKEVKGVALVHGLIVELDPYHEGNTTNGLEDTSVVEPLQRMVDLLTVHPERQPRLILCGHTHLATAWSLEGKGWKHLYVGDGESFDLKSGTSWYPLDPSAVWVVNVGSVGWQRDGNRRPGAASTAVYVLLEENADKEISISFRAPTYNLGGALREFEDRGASATVLRRVGMGS